MTLVETRRMCESLMELHGLNDWDMVYTNARVRFGSCRQSLKRISLSRPLVLLNDEHQVKDTILHEIAHALTPYHRHDKVWKERAAAIGCEATRCYNNKVITPDHKYEGICPSCDRTFKAYRRTNSYCARCCKNGYSDSNKIKWCKN